MPDVAIVGAGPVGMVAALALIQHGVEVTLLEQRAAPTEHSRSIGIHPPGLDVLDRVGCAEALIAAGVRIRHGEVRSGGAVLGTLAFRRASPRHPYVLAVPQWVTERVLRERLAQLAPTALVTSCEVTGARRTDDGMRLETSQGPVTARWAIGADGPHGAMRALGGFPMRVRPVPDRYVMADAVDATGLGDRAVLHLERDGVVESFPLPDGRRRWVAHRGTDPAPLDQDALAEVVRQRTGVPLDAASLTATSAFGVRHVWTDSPVRGRIVLLGDAAHEISPIGGQGMTLGWLDAAALAPALAEALRGGGENALTAYRSGAVRRQRVTSRQARFNTLMGRPRQGAALAARDLLVRIIARRAFERRLARAFTMAAPAAIGAPSAETELRCALRGSNPGPAD